MSKGFPMFVALGVELTSVCNGGCAWCARTSDRTGARYTPDGRPVVGAMPTEQAERILREAAALRFRGTVTFSYYSEPTLDFRLADMARLARSLGLTPSLVTNAVVLQHAGDTTALLAAFRSVKISLHRAKTSAAFLVGCTKWRQLAPAGVPVVFDSRADISPVPLVPMERPPRPGVPCQLVSQKLFVTFDGRLPVCCHDMRAEFGLPNAFGMPVRDMWWNPIRERAVADLRKGKRDSYPLCKVCPLPCRRIGWADAERLWGST